MTTMEWSERYIGQFEKNIGILTKEQQDRLLNSKVAIMGMGGIGSPCFEALVRSGVGAFSIVDKDIFEMSNINRQIFAFKSTVGKRKIDVAEDFAKDINPEVKICKYTHVDEENIDDVLSEVDVIVQAIDELKPCLITARAARMKKIPLVEGWALPYSNVRVFTENTVALEEAYSLPTFGKPLSAMNDEEFNKVGIELILDLIKKTGDVKKYFDEETLKRAAQGSFTSFCPMVWLASIMLSIETIKVILDWGEVAYAPDFSLYDPYLKKIPT